MVFLTISILFHLTARIYELTSMVRRQHSLLRVRCSIQRQFIIVCTLNKTQKTYDHKFSVFSQTISILFHSVAVCTAANNETDRILFIVLFYRITTLLLSTAAHYLNSSANQQPRNLYLLIYTFEME